jgi:signal transduction histidine kinase
MEENRRTNGASVVSALGVLYIVLASVRSFLVVSAGARLPGQLLNVLLVSVPALALAYCGRYLPRTDVPRDVHFRVAGWTLLAGGVIIAVLVVVEFSPGSGIGNLRLAALLFGALGSLGGFGIGLQEARAITEARETERQRRAVERYSGELERQNDRLESFAGMLAHELRNPLNIAQIYLQQVEDDSEAVEEIASGLDRIEEMIDILLVTVRGSEANIDWQTVALSEVAEDAWADLSPEEARLVVETDQAIRADPVHVRHLLKNLFGNAVEHGSTSPRSEAHEDAVEHGSTSSRPADDDAVEHGSTSPRSQAHEDAVEHCENDVTVRVGTLGDADGFYVEDDGAGIPEDARNEVVEAGYTTKSDGIGLGLTFVANLVDTYDWEWTITESEAGGARFEFSDVDVVTAAEPRAN